MGASGIPLSPEQEMKMREIEWRRAHIDRDHFHWGPAIFIVAITAVIFYWAFKGMGLI